MSSFATHLEQLIQELASLRPGHISQDELDTLVKEILVTVPTGSKSPELIKEEWTLAIRSRLMDLASKEGDVDPDAYFADLFDLLDIVLTLSEQGTCEPTAPLNLFEELLDTQTVPSCEVLWGWLETRVQRLTSSIHTNQAMSLAMLRTLNEILRRLSKSAHTPLCGRIMQLLASRIFRFGERSGVNLRGSFDLVNVTTFEETAEMNEYYTTFWSLQQYFRDPSILASKDPDGPSIAKFRTLLEKVLPAIAEATAKEKLLTGTKDAEGAASKKRKFSEMMSIDDQEDSFFPKFLTSTELLDYEMGDTGFRRTILFQMNIFLQHILYYTEKEKTRWQEPKNQSLQMGFILDADNEKWATATMNKIVEQLRQTVPGGRTMGSTAQLVTTRERNWIEWKIGLCKDIAKAPLPFIDMESVRRQMNDTASEERRFPSMIAIDLVEAYDDLMNGYEGPADLERDLHIPTLDDLLKRYKMPQERLTKRRKIIDTARQKQELANQKASEARKAQAAETLAKEREKLSESQKVAAPTAKPAEVKKDENALQLNMANKLGTPPATPPRPATPPVSQSTAASPLPSGSLSLAGTSNPAVTTPSKSAVAPGAPKPPIPSLPTDSVIVQEEMTISSLNWRALRIARASHLHFFQSIGIGELPLLIDSIQKGESTLQKASQASQPS